MWDAIRCVIDYSHEDTNRDVLASAISGTGKNLGMVANKNNDKGKKEKKEKKEKQEKKEKKEKKGKKEKKEKTDNDKETTPGMPAGSKGSGKGKGQRSEQG